MIVLGADTHKRSHTVVRSRRSRASCAIEKTVAVSIAWLR